MRLRNAFETWPAASASSLEPGATGVDLTLAANLGVGTSLTVTGDSALVGAVVVGGGLGIVGVELTVSGDVRASGEVQAPTIYGSNVVEIPVSPGVPTLRGRGTETDTGIGIGANEVQLIAGGSSQAIAGVLQFRTAGSGVELTSLGNFETRARIVEVKRTVDIPLVSSTISPTGAENVEVTLSAGNRQPTSTPFIADGADGQRLIITNVDGADTLTLPDEATTPGCNMELGAATRALGPNGGNIVLVFRTVVGAWCEESFRA